MFVKIRLSIAFRDETETREIINNSTQSPSKYYWQTIHCFSASARKYQIVAYIVRNIAMVVYKTAKAKKREFLTGIVKRKKCSITSL